MSYQERRVVVLPCGRWAEEIRNQEAETVNYRYEWFGIRLDVSHLKIEYNGQILDAREPDDDDDLTPLRPDYSV